MADLTSAGLQTRTQIEIQEAIEADQKAAISPSLDLSTSSPLGQVNRLFARSLTLAEEALAALYLAIDPDSATGDALDRLSALTGTIREPASRSRLTATLDLDAGTYAAGTLAVAPVGRPEDRFVNAEDVTSAGGNVTGVVFEAEETGPIHVVADSLAIAGPVSGWNAIVTSSAATPGSERETDAALRARRASEVESPGSSSAAGIAADISRNLPLVESVSVTENDTDATVDGVPPHAIEVIVYGPAVPTSDDNEAVARQILASKAAGIGTYGNTAVSVEDSEGVTRSISLTRPVVVEPTIEVDLVMRATAYAGDDSVTDAIVEQAADTYVPGLDVAWSQIAAWVQGVPGVLRITDIQINGVSFVNATITARQIASILAANVTINSTSGAP